MVVFAYRLPLCLAIQVQGLQQPGKGLRVLRGVDVTVARGGIFTLPGAAG